MQEKYQENFKTLSVDEADYFTDAISGYIDARITDNDLEIDGEILYNALSDHGIDHKTACMSLANDPSPTAVIILEKLIGHPIRKQIPRAQPVSSIMRRVQNDGQQRPKLIKNDPRVIYDIQEGAKRPGSKSYDRYKLYQEGMTVTEFIAAGGTAGDVKHDVSKGFIKLKDAE